MKRMKKWIIVSLFAFMVSFGVNSTVHADKKIVDKSYYALLQSKRKAKKHGKAVLKSKYHLKVTYKHRGKRIRKNLDAKVKMTAYFTRKSKKSRVTVHKVVVTTSNKSGLPLYYSQMGITRRGRWSGTVYKTRSRSMSLFRGKKVKKHATFKMKKRVTKAGDIFAFLNNSLGSVAFSVPGIASSGRRSNFLVKKLGGGGERKEFYISYY